MRSAERSPAPRKSLGQHFLTCRTTLEAIVAAAGLQPDEPVLEIGPGKGALTAVLLEHGARVTAVEKDLRMVELLRQRFDGRNLNVLHGDFLEADVPGLSASCPKVFGNLPYNVSLAILQQLLFAEPPFRLAVLMFQLEVAQRILAGPGSGDYGIPSVLTTLLSNARMLRRVEPGAFFPPPKVRSAVLLFEPRNLAPEQRLELSAFVDEFGRWFRYRRKTAANAMSLSGIPRELAARILEDNQVDPMCRLETLAPDRLFAIYRTLKSRIIP